MAILELLAVLAFVAVMALLVRRIILGARHAEAEWEPFHRYEDGCRRVYVRREAELEPVGEVGVADPDYEECFLALMSRARERAATLNSEL